MEIVKWMKNISLKTRLRIFTIILVVFIVMRFIGISFSIPSLNTFMFLVVIIAYVRLAMLWAPKKWYLDILIAVGGFFMFLMGLYHLLDLIDCGNPDLKHVKETEFCTQSGYGFVGTDSGTKLCAYERFSILNLKVGCHSTSVMYDSPKDNMGVNKFCKDKKIIELR